MKTRSQLWWMCALFASSIANAPMTAAQESERLAAASEDDAGTNESPIPIACDGALCDTTNDSTCSIASVGKRSARTTSGIALLAACCAALALTRSRSRRRRSAPPVATIMLAVLSGLTGVASADARTELSAASEREPVVDVAIHELKPVHRALVLEWNPLSLLVIQTLSFSAVWVPADHHAIAVTPFYADTTTVPISVYDHAGQQRILPKQEFRGFGAELGYRYYFELGGPRGFFFGPSLLLGSVTAKAMNGTKTPFLELGIAADVGWQALVADRVALALGLGLQVIETSKSVPRQQFPARVYADRGVLPRFLFSLGWAL